jgi:hypothetical protein
MRLHAVKRKTIGAGKGDLFLMKLGIKFFQQRI